MGAGKSTIGRLLSRRLSLDFIDLDTYIEARYHATVPELFKCRGEDGFRLLERNLLHEVGDFEDVLVSTGGGAPCFFDNMEYMNKVGSTVYLKATPEELARRLDGGPHTRPVLAGRKGADLLAFIEANLAQREDYYMLASFVLETSSMQTATDVSLILDELENMLK
jgi:shikimate kinase